MLKKLLIFLFMFNTIFSLEIKDKRIYDNYKNSIELKEYKRIVVYNYGVIEMLFKLDSGEKIVAVGDHKKSIWPSEQTKLIPNAGPISKPSVERILSFNPDLVIFNVMGNKVDELKKMGVPSLIYSNKSLDDIIKNFEIISIVVGKKNKGLEEVNKLKEKLNEIKEMKKLKGKALILYSINPPSSFSKNSLPVEILETLGLQVIIPTYGTKSIISSEYILQENPDIIIGTRGIKNKKEIESSISLIEETKAYKKNKIYQIDSTNILRGSHRVFNEIEKVYNKLEEN